MDSAALLICSARVFARLFERQRWKVSKAR
jgi:hypothetical protein